MRRGYRSYSAALALAVLAAGACKRVAQPTSNIVFRSADGRTLTLDQLESAKGPVNYEILGDQDVPPEARLLHEGGRQAGGAGDYKGALDLLTRAAKLAPAWPYPIYDRAFTYLLMKNFDAARADYLATVALSPRGYFTAITSADLLMREKKGELPAGTCLAYSLMEDMNDPAEKAKQLRGLVARIPKLAPAWKDLAYLANDDKERMNLIEKGLAAQPDAETRGMLRTSTRLPFRRGRVNPNARARSEPWASLPSTRSRPSAPPSSRNLAALLAKGRKP